VILVQLLIKTANLKQQQKYSSCLCVAPTSDLVVQWSASVEGVDNEPTGIAATAVIAVAVGLGNIAFGESTRVHEAVDLDGTLVDWRVQNHLVGLRHRCWRSGSGPIGSSIAADIVSIVTEPVQMVVLQRILSVVQPQIVRLALVESAAVVGNKGGEVQVTAESCIVTKIDGASAILRHSGSFSEIVCSVATNIPGMITEPVQVVVLERILAVVQPNIVRLTLVECAAVSRDEHGEVETAAVSSIVSQINWCSLSLTGSC